MEFIHFSPQIDLGFWTTLAKKKIEEYKLDDAEHQLISKYKINGQKFKEKQSSLILDIYSFQEQQNQDSGPLEISNTITFRNHNTIESYYDINPLQHLKSLASKLFKNPKPNVVEADIQIFADLKKYIFHYRFYVPQHQIGGIIVEQKQLINPSEDFKATLHHVITKQQDILQNSPFYVIKQNQYVDFQEYLTSEAKDQYEIVYIDSFNQEKFGPGLQNLLAYLILHKVQKVKVNVIKDFISLNAPIDLKISNQLSLDLTNAVVEKSANDEFVLFASDHYLKEIVIDLKGFMDESRLAAQAVDLNINLMKWRLLPQLDLEKIKSTKCLLFGAGTLGCQIARNLIAWGVRDITFVDNGKISYSNPVRQTLYDFEDSKNGGKPKAETAAIKLKQIFPDLNAQGFTLEIPMPGHYVTEQTIQRTLENAQFIDELVQKHDAIFLLTDSRESRWFPTLLANKYSKICLAVALGFDSFLIIRHGISVRSYNPEIHGERLACYFCNDIQAPNNSMKDRTLDQQCTVTKPSLSFLASGYSTELLISLIHSEYREGTPASDNQELLTQTDLGILPHFIRGQLSDYEVKLYYGRSFTNCVACSLKILEKYEENPQEFLLKVLNQPDYLQDASGITEELKNQKGYDETQIVEFDDFAIIQ
ncbi:hypothetical protein pb186bvf_001265 [Paramecium bursaria]